MERGIRTLFEMFLVLFLFRLTSKESLIPMTTGNTAFNHHINYGCVKTMVVDKSTNIENSFRVLYNRGFILWNDSYAKVQNYYLIPANKLGIYTRAQKKVPSYNVITLQRDVIIAKILKRFSYRP